MPRKKSIQSPQYGEPTSLVSIRMPTALHREVKRLAKIDRISKSRKIVRMLQDAVKPDVIEQEDVFG
jgi:hypothetical protein